MSGETLDGNDLGNVTEERSTKRSALESFPLPMSNSHETLIFDFDGVVRRIMIKGLFPAATKAEITTFIETIEAIVNGNQIGVPYVSELNGTKTVFIENFTYNYMVGMVLHIEYQLTLIEGEF